MSNLNDLYQEMILDHNQHPRNFGELLGANLSAEGHNPLCGDQVTVYLQMEGEVIRAVHFDGAGCAISIASASMMTEALTGRTVHEAEHLFQHFHELVTSGKPSDDLGKLEALSGVRAYPMRIKCATLAWHAMRSALQQQRDPVSTE